jgi:prevent-host-death family protein
LIADNAPAKCQTSLRPVVTVMPAEIGAYEAKTRLPALLERVARGEKFTITKHGRPIARLVPVERTGPDRRREAIERLKLFREGQTLDVPWKELIGEGRR